jgi:hypothetical protein
MRRFAPMLAMLLLLAAAGCAKHPPAEPEPVSPQEPAASEQAAEEPEPRIMFVAGQGVILYSQAGSFKSVLDELNQGEAVIWLGEYDDMTRVKVVRTGAKGWVATAEISDRKSGDTPHPEAQDEEKPPPPPPPVQQRQNEPKFILTF